MSFPSSVPHIYIISWGAEVPRLKRTRCEWRSSGPHLTTGNEGPVCQISKETWGSIVT